VYEAVYQLPPYDQHWPNPTPNQNDNWYLSQTVLGVVHDRARSALLAGLTILLAGLTIAVA
jgi:hypothetical protein